MPKIRVSNFEEEATTVDAEELFEIIKGSTGFTKDQYLHQLADSQDNAENFLMQHGESKYMVPLADINKFFLTHERPKKLMTAAQENVLLRRRLVEMEEKIEEATGAPVEKRKEFTGSTMGDTFQGRPTVTKTRPPASEPLAPPNVKADKMTETELLADIKKDLAGEKPKTASQMPQAKGRTGSPKVQPAEAL